MKFFVILSLTIVTSLLIQPLNDTAYLDLSIDPQPAEYLSAQSANDSILQCASDLMTELHESRDPSLAEKRLEIENRIYRWTVQDTFTNAKTQYTIPVVVHIVHFNGQGLVSDETIRNGIDRLNRGFANLGGYNRGAGFNTDFRFELALRAPDGHSTSGITRISSPLTNMPGSDLSADDDLKALRHWDATCYANVYVVNSIPGASGYATLPYSHGEDWDGIVVRSSVFDGSNAAASTLIHEFGHYLGLHHTFRGGCYNADCTRNGDYVCDTPPDKVTFYSSCTQPINSCNTDAQSGFFTDRFDMSSNFMDYTTRQCRHDFSSGQNTRMRGFILDERSSLLECESLVDPCPVKPIVQIDLPGDSIILGENVLINSDNQSVVRWNWYLDGESLGNTDKLEYTFNEEGVFELVLQGESSNNFCAPTSDRRTITVYCPEQHLDFTTELIVGDTATQVLCRAIVQQLPAWEWWIDSEFYSANTDTIFPLLLPGMHTIELKAIGGVEVCGFSPPDPKEIFIECPKKLLTVTGSRDWTLLGDTVSVEADFKYFGALSWYLEDRLLGTGPQLELSFEEPGFKEVVAVGSPSLEGCTEYRDTVVFEALCPLTIVEIVNYSDSVQVGNSLELSLLYENASELQWTVNGQSPVGSAESLIYHFDSAGLYEFVASATSIYSSCANSSDTIRVLSYCPGDSIPISIPAMYVKVGEEFDITTTTTDLEDLRWYIDGKEVSQDKEFQYSFFDPKAYEIVVTGRKGGSNCGQLIGRTTINAYCDLNGGVHYYQEPFVNEPMRIGAAIDGVWDSLKWYINGQLQEYETIEFETTFDRPGFYEFRLDVYYQGCRRQMRVGNVYPEVKERCQTQERVGFRKWNGFGELLKMFSETDNGDLYVGSDRGVMRIDRDYNVLWSSIHALEFVASVEDRVNGGVFSIAKPISEQEIHHSLLLKFSDEGELLWTKKFDGITRALTRDEKLTQLADGSFLVMGVESVTEELAFLHSISPSGELNWSRVYDNVIPGDIISDVNGEIIMVGRTYNDQGITIQRLTSKGEIIWSRVYQPEFSFTHEFYDFPVSPKMCALPDGSFALAFSQASFANVPVGHVAFFSKEGEITGTWQLDDHRNIDFEIVIGISALPGGDVILSTYRLEPDNRNGEVVNLTRIDPDGKVKWQHRKELSQDYFIPTIFQVLEDDRIALMGSSGEQCYIRMLDEDGFPESCPYRVGFGRLISRPFRLIPENDIASLGDHPWTIEAYNGTLPSTPYSFDPYYEEECVETAPQVMDLEAHFTAVHTCEEKLLIQLEVCNNGNIEVPTGTALTFYQKDPTAEHSEPLETLPILENVQPDSCHSLSYQIDKIDPESYLYVLVNENGTSELPIDLSDSPDGQDLIECNSFNNLDKISKNEFSRVNAVPLELGANLMLCEGDTLVLQALQQYAQYSWEDDSELPTRQVSTPGTYILEATDQCGRVFRDSILVELEQLIGPPELGADILYCEDRNIELEVSTDYLRYLWSNGSEGSKIEVSQSGNYWVEVEDYCGFVYRDSILLELEQEIPLDLGEELLICRGDSVSLSAAIGFANYQWSNVAVTPCTDCTSITITPEESMEVTLTATSFAGCIFSDTLVIEVVEATEWTENVQICSGDSVLIFDLWRKETGQFRQTFSSILGCDSTVQVNLSVHSPIEIQSEISPTCFGQANGEIRLSTDGDMSSYSIQWSNGATGSLVPGLSAGNYSYTLTDDQGCESSDQVEVPAFEDIAFDVDWLDPACQGEASGSITLTAISEGLSFSLDGQNFQASGSFEELASGDYNILIRDLNGCERISLVQLVEPEPLVLEVPSNLSINQGDTIPIVIGGQIDRITSIQWTPAEGLSCTDCLNPLVFPDADKIYQVVLTDDQGCQLSYSVTVEVEVVSSSDNPDSKYELDLPTAFSPNGDGVNDRFEILGLERYPKSSIVIVDRWGKVVYQANPYANNWDGRTLTGKALPEGVYYYALDLSFGNLKPLNRSITLIR